MSGSSPSLHLWRVHLGHDGGTHVLRLTATSEANARAIVCTVEHCPERAIRKIEDLGPVDKAGKSASS